MGKKKGTMNDPDPEILRGALFEVIENQIRDRTPPETKDTYDRLRAEGYSEEEAMKLIGCALSSELFDILKSEKPYNETRYIAALKALPQLPWED